MRNAMRNALFLTCAILVSPIWLLGATAHFIRMAWRAGRQHGEEFFEWLVAG